MLLQLSPIIRKPTLMGTETLTIRMFYKKELCKSWILILHVVPLKSVEKWGS